MQSKIKDLSSLFNLSIIGNKYLFIPYFLFFIVNLFYLSNPYLNNSGDFISTSHLLIVIEIAFFFIWNYSVSKFLDSQLNFQLTTERDISKENCNLAKIIVLLVYFMLFQIATVLLFNLFYSFIFGFSISLFTHVTVLYITYFFLSSFTAFLIAIYFIIVNGNNKPFYELLSFLILIAIIIVYYWVANNFDGFNFLFTNKAGYYNPFTGIVDFEYDFFIKLSLVILIITLILSWIIINGEKVKWLVNVLLFVSFIAFFIMVFGSFHQEEMKNYYLDSYVNERESVENILSNIKVNNNYTIKSYDIQINDKKHPQFVVDIRLEDIKKKELRLYLNESFKVSHISSKAQSLPFKQKNNIIDLSVHSTQDQTITIVYSGNGTSLNPVQSGYIFLPYFFGWLPSNEGTNDYRLTEYSTLEFNPQKRSCSGEKSVSSEFNNVLVLPSFDNQDCLTIVKGDFTKKVNNGYQLYYPKVWSGNVGSVGDYLKLNKKVTKLFNQVFDVNKTISTDSLLIMPKYPVNSQNSMNDFWVTNKYQVILMNPFLNINDESLFRHVSKKSIFNLPYSMLRSKINNENEEKIEMLSILFAVYFMEKNDYPLSSSYLDFYITVYGIDTVKEFRELKLEQKKDRLVQIYNSI